MALNRDSPSQPRLLAANASARATPSPRIVRTCPHKRPRPRRRPTRPAARHPSQADLLGPTDAPKPDPRRHRSHSSAASDCPLPAPSRPTHTCRPQGQTESRSAPPIMHTPARRSTIGTPSTPPAQGHRPPPRGLGHPAASRAQARGDDTRGARHNVMAVPAHSPFAAG